MFDFPSISLNEGAPIVFGRIVDFIPKFHEVKVFKKDEEQSDMASDLNKRLNSLRNIHDNTGAKFITDTLLG